MERLSLHSTCRGVLTVQVMMNMNMGQPCHAGQDRLASIQQALEASRATDPCADVTLSDVEEAAP